MNDPQEILSDAILKHASAIEAPRKQTGLYLDIALVAVRAVYLAAAGGNVTCLNAVNAMETILAKAGNPIHKKHAPIIEHNPVPVASPPDSGATEGGQEPNLVNESSENPLRLH